MGTVPKSDLKVIYSLISDEGLGKCLKDYVFDVKESKYSNHNPGHYKRNDDKVRFNNSGFAFLSERCDDSSIIFVNVGLCDDIGKYHLLAKDTSSVETELLVPHIISKPQLVYNPGKTFSSWLSSNKGLALIPECSQQKSFESRVAKDGIWVLDIVMSLNNCDVKSNPKWLQKVVIITSKIIKDQLSIELRNIKVIGKDIHFGNTLTSNNNGGSYGASDKLLNDNNEKLKINFKKFIEVQDENTRNDIYIIPSYKIKHVNHRTLQDYSVIKEDYPPTLRPQVLHLDIDLPQISSASEIDVETSGKELHLKTIKEVKYILDLILPFKVENDPKSAKFDISTSVLSLELNVSKCDTSKVCCIESANTVQYIQTKESDNADLQTVDSGIECESGYRTSSDGVISSTEEIDSKVSDSEQKQQKNDITAISNLPKTFVPSNRPSENNIDYNTNKNDFLEWKNLLNAEADVTTEVKSLFKRPLLPNCLFTQKDNYINIIINCEGTKVSDFHIESIDSKIFQFQYKYLGKSLTPLIYGSSVCTAPHTYKSKGITHTILSDSLVIEVEKKKPVRWHKIKYGSEPKKMKEIKLPNPSKSNNELQGENQLSSTKPESEDESLQDDNSSEQEHSSEDVCRTEPVSDELAELSDVHSGEKSKIVPIPQLERRKSDYFVTSSWPRGILKVRSRSLSDSQMDFKPHSTPLNVGYGSVFSSSLEDEAISEDAKFDLEEEEEEEEICGSSPTKKSVRFNEYVCKQLFNSSSSILASKAKTQKKAMQRKRSRERKLSEGTQSSDTETHTTEDDSATESKKTQKSHQNSSKEKSKKQKKKGSNKPKGWGPFKNRKNNRKPFLNISNDMLFQLDEI